MRRFIPILLALLVLLSAAVFMAWKLWTGFGDSGMNGNGVAALVIGAIGSLILGGGLMALVFYSSRRGYDERADIANLDDSWRNETDEAAGRVDQAGRSVTR